MTEVGKRKKKIKQVYIKTQRNSQSGSLQLLFGGKSRSLSKYLFFRDTEQYLDLPVVVINDNVKKYITGGVY